jgi:hypothetical protein
MVSKEAIKNHPLIIKYRVAYAILLLQSDDVAEVAIACVMAIAFQKALIVAAAVMALLQLN